MHMTQISCGTYRCCCILREKVGGVKGTRHSLVELSIPVIGRLNDGELESAGVLQIQVQLAVLGLVRSSEAWANVCLETIETKSNDLKKA